MILSRPTTPYNGLSPIFDRKVMSMKILNLVPSLLKVLSHLATSYLVSLHLITF